METETIQKNGANPKSQTSRGKHFTIALLLAACALLTLASCNKDKSEEVTPVVQQFCMKVQVASGGSTISIEVVADALSISWGDSSTPNSYSDTASCSHTYSAAGTYTITGTGDNIRWLQCPGTAGMKMQELDVSKLPSLQFLNCDDNQQTSLDISHNTALTYLWCNNNQLTSLDISHNTALNTLDCRYNQLTSLDLSHNTALDFLRCYANRLTSLDLSHNTALTYLDCFYNQLTSLDLSHNTALAYLVCSSNQLTSLDLSHNTAFGTLSCTNNQLSAAALNALFTSLRTLSSGSIWISGNPGAATCNRSIATAKGWVFQ